MKYRYSFDLSVYFIADPHCCGGRPIDDVVAQAVKGGATMVQLRNKHAAYDQVKAQALVIKDILAESATPFIINDHVALAADIDADGVHIGQEDMSVREARKIIGEDKILGLTAFTMEHYTALDPNFVDYTGTGPFYRTKTKPDKPVLGANGFAKLAKDSPVPVVGIGGITPQNARDVVHAGAQGVAMMRSISEAEDPAAAARLFADEVSKAHLDNRTYP